MDIRNILRTNGDNNITLQNITANDITIITGKEENPEVIGKKQYIADEIAKLINRLDEKREDGLKIPTGLKTESFEGIDFNELTEAIKIGNCILFIGPEISVDDSGENLHEKFYSRISKKNIMEYDLEDHFFMPGSEIRLTNKMINYYTDTFYSENKTGSEILEKLAQIPFTLIISACPDTTILKIYDEHNKKPVFLYYNENEQEAPEPAKETQVIYNFLGNPGVNGKFIFTFHQFHNYINQKQAVKVPLNIEEKVLEAVHYLFIGFDFDKWHNRLALLSFNLNHDTESFTFSNAKMKDSTKEFILKQFNITYIDQDYSDFVDVLLQETHKRGISKSLREVFVTNTLNALERIRVKTIDINKLEQLIDLENDLNYLKNKYFSK